MKNNAVNNQSCMVSIVCDVYNHEPYLRDCLDGFVKQVVNFTYEILIHDDCSTDKSKEIIKEYVDKYPHLFKPIYQKVNQYSQGISTWAKFQFPRANGKYIALCEGDDYWTDPYKLQKQVDFMESHVEVGLCCTDFDILYEDNGRVEKAMFRHGMFQPRTFEEHLMNSGYIAPMTWMYRRSILEEIDFKDSNTDGSFALALEFFQRSNVAYLDDVTAVYRVHQNSVTTQKDIQKRWAYTKGINETQIALATKYSYPQELIDRIKQQGYITDMLLAIEADDKEFINEALTYFSKRGFVMKWFVNSCKEYVRYKKQYEQIRTSKAYRIGKALLKPFQWLKR